MAVTLSELISIFPQIRWGDGLGLAQQQVAAVVSDSRQVVPHSVFVAMRGTQFDGHDVLPQVGVHCLAMVVEDEKKIPKEYKGPYVLVSSTREALAMLAAKFYDFPSRSMFCAAVTGTNGKTTSTYIIESLLTHFGWPTGVIGTIDHHLGSTKWETGLTTPDAVTFQKRLSEFRTAGARAVALEASSHALEQGRVNECDFDAVIFTNLTRDHLDYHGTMENYFVAKALLFDPFLTRSSKSSKTAVINIDDPWGAKLMARAPGTVWGFGQAEGAHLRFQVLRSDFSGSEFELTTPMGRQKFFVPMIGLHNVYNATGAIGVGLGAGAGLETLADGLKNLGGVPGRLQRVTHAELNVFVDYAHTDDGLRSVLSQLDLIRKASPQRPKIITVFGCGGDRDKGKRPMMLAAAKEFSDQVIVTSDNPRSENPAQIISDILAGSNFGELGKQISTEVDRAKAIAKAVSLARPGDVVLIAGKGHEKYQIIGKDKIPFDDVAVAASALGGK